MAQVIRLIRIYNPMENKVQSFLASRSSFSIGSGESADVQVAMPSLLYEHLRVDFGTMRILPFGPDIYVDGVPLQTAPHPFSNGSITKLRGLTFGLYTSLDGLDEASRRLREESNATGSDGGPIVVDEPVMPPGFGVSHCDCVIEPVDEREIPPPNTRGRAAREAAMGGEPTAANPLGGKRSKRRDEQPIESGEPTGTKEMALDDGIHDGFKKSRAEMDRRMAATYASNVGGVSGLNPVEEDEGVKRLKTDAPQDMPTMASRVIEETAKEVKDDLKIDPEDKVVSAYVDRKIDRINKGLEEIVNGDVNVKVKTQEHGDLGRTVIDKGILEDAKSELESRSGSSIIDLSADKELVVDGGTVPQIGRDATMENVKNTLAEQAQPSQEGIDALREKLKTEITEDVKETVTETVRTEVAASVASAVSDALKESNLSGTIVEILKEQEGRLDAGEDDTPSSPVKKRRGPTKGSASSKKGTISSKRKTKADTQKKKTAPVTRKKRAAAVGAPKDDQAPEAEHPEKKKRGRKKQ